MNKLQSIFYVLFYIVALNTYSLGQLAINAIDFDGIDDGVSCGTDTSLDISEFITMEAWIKADSIQPHWGYHRIIDKYWFTIQQGYNLVLESGSKVSLFDFWATDGSKHTIVGNVPLTDQTWHHVAATYDGNIMKLYLDGQVETADTIGQYFIRQCSNSLNIGNNTDGNVWFPYGGEIDQVRLWNIARTQQQIQKTLYDTLSSIYYTNPDSGLVGYWKFDVMEDLGINGDGSDDIRDFSYFGNHGDTYNDPVLVPSGVPLTHLEEVDSNIPKGYNLHQNYPNPFNPRTNIQFSISKTEKVKIEIFNLLGQKVETLLNKNMTAGKHEVEFTAKDLPGGVYIYRIVVNSHGEAGEYREVKKMILLK